MSELFEFTFKETNELLLAIRNMWVVTITHATLPIVYVKKGPCFKPDSKQCVLVEYYEVEPLYTAYSPTHIITDMEKFSFITTPLWGNSKWSVVRIMPHYDWQIMPPINKILEETRELKRRMIGE